MKKQKYLIAANWKQNGDLKSLTKLVNDIIKLNKKPNPNCEILLLPPSIYLNMVHDRYKHYNVSQKKMSLGIQNISPFMNGAYTGEVSISMIKDYKCSYALIGHSERRHIFLEDNKVIERKIKLSLESNINTILCVGETLAEYNKKLTKKVISIQLRSALSKSVDLFKSNHDKIVIAYEPVWAIGTGKTATLCDIADVHEHIKKVLSKMLRSKNNTIKILYGGSVNEGNAKSILNLSDVNGALVGGASLNSKKLIDICSSI